MSTSSVEIVYRGVLQMLLARRIGRGLVLAARQENKLGFTFGRYGDSPERIGIPAKQFAVIGDTERELQQFMTPYELADNDVTVVLDDTLCRGVESWAWHGQQPINRLTKHGGTLLVLSQMNADDLLAMLPVKEAEYNLAVVRGSPVWSSMWRYDDDTDGRILGAIARVAPHIISLASVERVIADVWHQEDIVDLAHQSFDHVQIKQVRAGEDVEQASPEIELPTWQQMGEALVIPAIPSREEVAVGPYQAERNPNYKSQTARTNRPVLDFAECSRCRLCWLHCPEASFNIMPDGAYDFDLEYCNGCGICASICPVNGCITMVSEHCFADNTRQWEMWQKDSESYAQWLEDMRNKAPAR